MVAVVSAGLERGEVVAKWESVVFAIEWEW